MVGDAICAPCYRRIMQQRGSAMTFVLSVSTRWPGCVSPAAPVNTNCIWPVSPPGLSMTAKCRAPFAATRTSSPVPRPPGNRKRPILMLLPHLARPCRVRRVLPSSPPRRVLPSSPPRRVLPSTPPRRVLPASPRRVLPSSSPRCHFRCRSRPRSHGYPRALPRQRLHPCTEEMGCRFFFF